MKYKLYNEQQEYQGTFGAVQELRNFLCDRKYEKNCDIELSCTFDYIKSIIWYFDIEE